MSAKIKKQLKARRAVARRAAQAAIRRTPEPASCRKLAAAHTCGASRSTPEDHTRSRTEALLRAKAVWNNVCGSRDPVLDSNSSSVPRVPPKRMRLFQAQTEKRECPIAKCLSTATDCVGIDGVVAADAGLGLRVLSEPGAVHDVKRLLCRAQYVTWRIYNEGDELPGVKLGAGASNVVLDARSMDADCLSECMGISFPTQWGDAVIRITRPGCERALEDVVAELAHLLHAACSGYGLDCIAATTYRKNDAGDKWGMMVVYPKACDLNAGASRVVGNAQIATFLFESAFNAIRSQARAGALQIDAKPGNYVCTPDHRAWAIDFDPSMFSVAEKEPPSALMLVSLSFFSAHIRLYYKSAVADLFSGLVFPVVRRLLDDVPATHWCLTTRAMRRKTFEAGWCYSPKDISNRMQSVATAYFANDFDEKGVHVMPMDDSTNDKSLLKHMLEYALDRPCTSLRA